MLGVPVPEGALFYAETRRRVVVPFDAELRALTEAAAMDLARVLAAGEDAAAHAAEKPLPRLLAPRPLPA